MLNPPPLLFLLLLLLYVTTRLGLCVWGGGGYVPGGWRGGA